MAFTALHIGDLHFWDFPRSPMDMLGKRVLGVANLALRRSRAFRQDRAPLLAERLASLKPDWVLFSGDFTTTSLGREFSRARAALAPVEGRIRAVPGNHDRYTRRDIRRRTFESHLGPWAGPGTWPYFEELGNGVWLAGIDATTSNGMDC